MYESEYDRPSEEGDIFAILDPDGDIICYVIGKDPADALLSHLNR